MRTSDARAFYANLVTAKAGTRDTAIRAAFERIDRALFLAAGPWKIFTASGYIDTPSDDETFIWQDIPIAIAPERGINNGEPSLHARCLAACNPQAGEHVVHIGAGTGYYTALLADLVGAAGRVDAFEIEPDIAAMAGARLQHLANVTVHSMSASQGSLPASDVIYVNAGATRPLDNWLDALNPGGRLIFPLTSTQGAGFMLLLTRVSDAALAARIVCPAAFIACAGARDEEESRALMTALAKGRHGAIRSLRRGESPDDSAWLSGRGWWLSTREP